MIKKRKYDNRRRSRVPMKFTDEQLKNMVMITDGIQEKFAEVKHILTMNLIDDCFVNNVDAMLAIEEMLNICRGIVKQWGHEYIGEFSAGMKMIEKYLDDRIMYPLVKECSDQNSNSKYA